MAQVVEFVGPPGSGKSSVAAALSGRRLGSRTVVGIEAVTLRPRSSLPLAQLVHGATMRRSGRAASTLDRMLCQAVPADERAASLAGRADEWRPLLDFLAGRTLGTDVTDPMATASSVRRLYAPLWLTQTLEARALAEDAPDGLVVVMHEGLLQRAGVVCGRAPDEVQLAQYARLVPPLAAVVHLRCSTGLLVERVLGRRASGSENVRHIGLDERELQELLDWESALLARTVQAYRLAGGRTIVLDADEDGPAVLADRIARALVEKREISAAGPEGDVQQRG